VNVPKLELPTRQFGRWLALTVLPIAQLLVVLSTLILNVALPEIRTGLELAPQDCRRWSTPT
jgi:hypothetical protein